MKIPQKGIASIIIPLIIAIILGGGYLAFIYSKKSTPTAETYISQTYRNEEYEFELQLPIDWKETKIFSELGGYENSIALIKSSREAELKKSLISGSDIGAAIIQDAAIFIKPVADDYLFNNLEKNRPVITTKEKLIDGKNILYIIYSEKTDPGKFAGGSREIYVFSKEGFVLEANYAGADPTGGLKTVFDRVISTFKFINSPTSTETANRKTYSNEKYGFEFKYPSLLSVKQEGGETITLNHSIAYKHNDPCDFKGDALPLERLTDFSASFTVSSKNLEDTKQDNFVWSYDKFEVGSLVGLKGESGVEGCGRYTYLFPISDANTMVIQRAYITEFNSIIADYQSYLALPGIVTPDQAEEFFVQILSTLKFSK